MLPLWTDLLMAIGISSPCFVLLADLVFNQEDDDERDC